MWNPVLFTRNSGELVKASNNERVGGFRWYMPSEFHGHTHPLPGCSSLFEGAHVPGEVLPPWILQERDGKVFVGEYFHLDDRLNVGGNVHAHALNGSRKTAYLYGFVADAGTPIPSRAEMVEMTTLWRDELGRLITKLNGDVGLSAIDSDYLRSGAKSMEELMPEGRAITGRDYGDNLWDIRAKEVNRGEKLGRPVLVNAKEITAGKNSDTYAHLVEIEGVSAGIDLKKKSLGNRSTVASETLSKEPLTPWVERLEESTEKFRPFSKVSPSWGRPVAMTCLVSLVVGCAAGVWILHQRSRPHQQREIDRSQGMPLNR